MKQAPASAPPPASLSRGAFTRHCLFAAGKYAVCLLPMGGTPAQYELRLVYHQRVTNQFIVMGGGRRPDDVIQGNWRHIFQYDDPDSNAVFNGLLQCPVADTARLTPAQISDLVGGDDDGM